MYELIKQKPETKQEQFAIIWYTFIRINISNLELKILS